MVGVRNIYYGGYIKYLLLRVYDISFNISVYDISSIRILVVSSLLMNSDEI